MAEFVQTMKDWRRMCNTIKSCNDCPMHKEDGWAYVLCSEGGIASARPEVAEKVIVKWAAEHPEPVYETWFEYLLRIGVIPENAPAGGEYQWIVESIKHKHISNDIAKSLKLHPKEVQA